MKTLLALASATAALAAPVATAAPATIWYWTPGLCKSNLQHYGMQIDDGRTFYVQQAYCIGSGGTSTCEFSSNYRTRLYTQFTAITRSYDGTVRMFTLKTVTRTDYRASNIRALGNEPNASKFAGYVSAVSHYLATKEHNKGCAPYQP